MPSIRDQSRLYHLTDIVNLASICEDGLKPRSQLSNFSDVADQEIITSRQTLGLQNYVPFHFFANNPFDGAVQRDHPNKTFILIAVDRSYAQEKKWKIVPRHPLASQSLQLFDYSQGMDAIDWDAMNRRAYLDDHSRSVCMAECLSPTIVPPSSFAAIYVKNEASQKIVQDVLKQNRLKCHVNLNSNMFK